MAETDFATRLNQRIAKLDTRVCVGIDPRPEAHPLTHPQRFDNDPAQVSKAVLYYFQAIIEATADLAACYKLQAAFFEAMGIPGLIAMAQLLAFLKSHDLPVILDAKRGDIGVTAQAYARAYLADGVFAADALTVNPYLGWDSLEPFIAQAQIKERGLFLLLKTSNPGSGDLQDLELRSGLRLYEHLAQQVYSRSYALRDESSDYSLLGAVVGATHPEELAWARQHLPHSLLLVPGYGAQGGEAEDVVAAFDAQGLGAIVNSSRGLTYLSQADDFAQHSQQATRSMRDAINQALQAGAKKAN